MKTYETGKGIKFYEEDNYKEGCLQNTGGIIEIDVSFKGNTAEDVINKICEFFGVEKKDIELNSCDEDGRIDIEIMEDDDSNKATERKLKEWKNGKIRLWYSVYTYKIQEVERKPVKL